MKELDESRQTDGIHLEGIHTYNILRNIKYTQLYQYTPVYTNDRDGYIIDDDEDEDNNCYQSDLVRIALNLGYINLKKL